MPRLTVISTWNDRGIRNAERDLARLQSAATKAGDGMSAGLFGASRTLNSVSGTTGRLGSELTRNVTLPLAGLGAVAVNESVKFESAFAGVVKTVDGTAEQMSALRQGIIDMANEIPASREQIAAVGEAAGQLGIETDNILDFTRVMIDLGESTNLTADEAATAFARFANIVQMPQDEFDRLGSTVVDLGNNMATTEAEIVEMGMRIAGAGSQVGMTEPQIMALGASLSSVGIDAEAGGTAISKTMIGIETAVQKGGDQLETWAATAGMSAQDFAAAWESDPATALNSVITGLGEMEAQGGSTLQQLENLGITEVRQRDALLRAAGAGDLLSGALKIAGDAWSENGALAEEAGRRYETTESRLEVAKNQATDAAMQIGDNLAPSFLRLVEGVAELARKFSALSPKQQDTIVKFGLAAAAAGPLLTVVSKVTGGAAKLVGGLGKVTLAFGKGISAAPKWAKAVAGGAKAAAGLVKQLALGVARMARQAAMWAVDTARKVANTAATWASIAAQKAAALGSKAWAAAQWLLNAAMSANPIGLVVAAIAALVAGLIYAWNHSEKFREIVTKAWEAIKTAAVTVFTAVRDWIVNTWDGIKTKTTAAFDSIKAFFQKWGPTILKVITGPIGALIITIVQHWDTIKAKTSAAFNGAKDLAVRAFQALKTGIMDKATAIVEWVKGLPGRITSALGNVGNLLKNAGRQIIEGLWNGLKERFEAVKSWVNGIASWIVDHKGPLDYDRRLLEPAGQAIMTGLGKGLASGWGGVARQLDSYTGAIAGSSWGAPTGGLALGMGSASVTIARGAIVINLPPGSPAETAEAAGEGVLAALVGELRGTRVQIRAAGGF